LSFRQISAIAVKQFVAVLGFDRNPSIFSIRNIFISPIFFQSEISSSLLFFLVDEKLAGPNFCRREAIFYTYVVATSLKPYRFGYLLSENCMTNGSGIFYAFQPGLPDFSWYMTPKPEKMYQMNTQCAKWS
jgi:hypothetical protein